MNIRQVWFWFVCFCKAVEVYSFKEDTSAKVFQNQGHTYAFLGVKVATRDSVGHTQEPTCQLLSSLSWTDFITVPFMFPMAFIPNIDMVLGH